MCGTCHVKMGVLALGNVKMGVPGTQRKRAMNIICPWSWKCKGYYEISDTTRTCTCVIIRDPMVMPAGPA